MDHVKRNITRPYEQLRVQSAGVADLRRRRDTDATLVLETYRERIPPSTQPTGTARGPQQHSAGQAVILVVGTRRDGPRRRQARQRMADLAEGGFTKDPPRAITRPERRELSADVERIATTAC